MRWLLGIGIGLIAGGCDSSSGSTPHPSMDGGTGPTADAFVECAYHPPESALCQSTCGNATVDDCYVPMMVSSHCTLYLPAHEACDGAAPTGASCTSIGFYDGEIGCNSTCTGPDSSRCGVCASGVTCTTSIYGGGAVAVSGTHLATLGVNHIQFFSGTSATTSIQKTARSITATATGWLTSDGVSFQAVGFDGTLGANVPLSAPGFDIAPGPGSQLTAIGPNNLMTEVQLVDATGTAVTARTAVFASTDRFGVATDGAHAFIGGVGSLATLASDGTAITRTGFPSGDAVTVTWDGTTGWYVTATATQRFDSAGAPVGAAIPLPSVTIQAIADGADLVAVVRIGSKNGVQRIHPDGTADPPVEIGAGGSPAAARIAGQLVLVWGTGWEAVLATVP